MTMRSGLFLPIFDEFADPAAVARLSVAAEQAGWHGVFLWDHVRWREPVSGVADPRITLAAVAPATEHVLERTMTAGQLPRRAGATPDPRSGAAAAAGQAFRRPVAPCWSGRHAMSVLVNSMRT